MARTKVEWVARFKQEALRHQAALKEQLVLFEVLTKTRFAEPLSEAGLESLRELFRLVHTIKGSARMVALADIADIAEQLEETFGEAYMAEIALSVEQQNRVQALVGQLETALNQV